MALLLPACARSRPPQHLERMTLARLEERLRAGTRSAPGIVFGAVWRDGTTVIRAAGAADLRSGRKVAAETPFNWFSLTKPFTATAILQLAERGLIDLDAPVARYLPDVRLHRDGQDATVRDLLTHTSGLANPLPIRWVHLAAERGPSLEEMIRQRVGPDPRLKSVPGTKRAYSNLGFLLLGEIVARVSGMPYERYVEEHVLAPLGCRRSGFAIPADAATGYQRRWSFMGVLARFVSDRRLVAHGIDGYWALKPFAVDGAPYGGLNGPASCLLSLANMMLNDGRGGAGRVLSPGSVRAMLEPSRTRDGRIMGIGLAWMLDDIDGEPAAHHEGGGGGFHAELWIYPRRGYAVAVLANETSFATNELTRVVITDPPDRDGGGTPAATPANAGPPAGE
jgi:CubicO group peptidase (beta-lactamase class C family)